MALEFNLPLMKTSNICNGKHQILDNLFRASLLNLFPIERPNDDLAQHVKISKDIPHHQVMMERIM